MSLCGVRPHRLHSGRAFGGYCLWPAVIQSALLNPPLVWIWGQPTYNRPALEAQMAAIRRAAPQINNVSHFAYSWQDPEFDRVRKFCSL